MACRRSSPARIRCENGTSRRRETEWALESPILRGPDFVLWRQNQASLGDPLDKGNVAHSKTPLGVWDSPTLHGRQLTASPSIRASIPRTP